MNAFDVAKLAFSRGELSEKGIDSTQIFKSLTLRKGDLPLSEVPGETNECEYRSEGWGSLFWMPGNTERGDSAEDLLLVVGVCEVTVRERAIDDRIAEGGNIILIFEDWVNTFCSPDVDDCICNHTGVAACRRGTEGDRMVNEELALTPLEDKPRFMVRKGRAGAVEFRNIDGACLGARGG